MNLFHRFRNELANCYIIISCNRSNLFDFLVVFTNHPGLTFQALNYFNNRFIDPSFEIHRICSCSNILQTYLDNRLGQNSCCCCPISCIISSLRSHFFDHLGSHVFKIIGKFNFLGNGYAILGNLRRTKFFINNHISSFRTQCYLYCICQCINTLFKFVTGLYVKLNFFCHF